MSAVALAVRQNTPAWVDARKDYIGSSDIPVLMGNSPYRTSPFSLWAIKTRKAEPEPVDPMTQELFDLGHALEPVIADRYVAMTSKRVRRANRMLVHRDIPWAAASLDRVIQGERRILELKWVPWRRWVEGPEPVPAYVQDQVQWQLMVKGEGWRADVAVLNGSHVEHHSLEPDEAYQRNLLTVAEDFYRNHIQTGIPPEMDGSEATRKALLRLWPDDDGTVIDPTPELEALMHELRQAIPALKAAEEHDGRIRNAIRLLMEQHAEVTSPTWSVESATDRWRVTYRKSKDGTKADWKSISRAYRTYIEAAGVSDELEAELDAIESLHTVPTEGSRRLVPTWKDKPAEEETSWT